MDGVVTPTLPRLTMITASPVAFGDVRPSVQELKRLRSEDPSYTTLGDASPPGKGRPGNITTQHGFVAAYGVRSAYKSLFSPSSLSQPMGSFVGVLCCSYAVPTLRVSA